jgi:hypothetical protein
MTFIGVNGEKNVEGNNNNAGHRQTMAYVDTSAALLNRKPADPNDESLQKLFEVLARAFIHQFARFVEQLRRGGNFDLRLGHDIGVGEYEALPQRMLRANGAAKPRRTAYNGRRFAVKY